MNMLSLKIGFLGTNCYIFGIKEYVYIIDPGGSSDRILAALKDIGESEVRAILLTHAHIDHIAAINDILQVYGSLDVFLHQKDEDLYHSPYNSIMPILPPIKELPKTKFNLDIEGITVIHTPGHTPGSVSFYIENEGVIFTGDTLFAGSIGRTDLPGGSYNDIINSIKNRLFSLPDNVMVYPGHGRSTTIGLERRNNPFFK